MIQTRQAAKEQSARLHDARKNQEDGSPSKHYCNEPFIIDGLNYRLEPKPKGSEERLTTQGFKCEQVQGLLHVHIPLGKHGTTNLGIDSETDEIVCLHCRKGGE